MAMAMAFMFVLITIVIAMHTTQSRAARAVTQAEAEVQFRQSAEFAAANLLKGDTITPASLRVTSNNELVGDFNMPKKYADKLWDGLPNWNPEGKTYAPGHRTYKVTPTTTDSALKVFQDNYLWLTAHDEGGYAVYAPKGSVKLEKAVGWANPNFLDERKSVEAYSGVPLLVAAKADIEIESMPYGNAYSSSGPIDLGTSKTNSSIGFVGPLPLRAYENALKQSLSDAKTKLEATTASGDKSHDISGGVLSTVGQVLGMLSSGNSSNLSVSLEQAMSFPFPLIPGFSATIPGVFYEFWFHMPNPPDFYTPSTYDSESKEGADIGAKVKQLDADIKKLKNDIMILNAQINAATDDDIRDHYIEKRDEKEEELEDKLDKAKAIQESLKQSASDIENAINSKMSVLAVPTRRSEDTSIPIPDTGLKGWAYGPLLSKMLSLLTSLISGDFTGIAESGKTDVRLVHFGPKENIPDFKFNDGFKCDSSFTVPRGRSFRFNGKMTVVGDLWLQKGSVMQVTGDLVLSNPDPSDTSPLAPSGKIVMEEGSSLIVGGNLKGAGSPLYGSLWTCSPPTHLAPITSSIFVSKNASLPYGSFSATNLEDVARNIEGLNSLGDAFEVLFTDIAPNLAKIAGPFHVRQPYFASYATTFQLTIVPTPIGPIPVPSAIPLPKKNVLIPLFRALTFAYTGSMNVSLGENLYQRADWWVFGDGSVPAMIKLDPLGPINSIKNLNLAGLKPNLDWKDYVTKLTATILKDAIEYAIKEVGQKLITEVIGSIAPGGSLISQIIDEVIDMVNIRNNSLEDLQNSIIQAAIEPITGQFTNFKSKLEKEIENAYKEAYLREVGGPLLYAESITVGDSGGSPRLMAGMLVAENNINLEAKTFVGSLTSFSGSVTAKDVYFTPLFTRASLYLPKSTSNIALVRAAEFKYGKRFDSKQSVDVGTGVWQVTAEGWAR